MFYELKKDGELVERFNPPAYPKDHKLAGKSMDVADADQAALAKAKELKADEVVTSAGRKVL